MSFVVHSTMGEMLMVNHPDDVSLFAGKVVAYKVNEKNSNDFLKYTVKDIFPHFGYVEPNKYQWGSGESGYNLAKLVKNDSTSHLCPLIASKLTFPILMRLATPCEINGILKAINENLAQFDFIYNKNFVGAILSKQLLDKWPQPAKL